MTRVVASAVTRTALTAIDAILRYRYLSVYQVATICGVKPKSASELLLRLERQGLLDHFGNVGIRGYGKTPKVYFAKKAAHRLLVSEFEAMGRCAPAWHEINITRRWSPLMFHRLDTLDVLASVERDCCALEDYRLVGTLVEYRRERVEGRWRKETTDYVSDRARPEDKIIPDAGFALEHRESGKRALFLIEVDCGTERLTSTLPAAGPFTDKLAQYDRYLASGRVGDRFSRLGSFSGFHLLVITTSDRRIANMRKAAATLSADFHHLFRFSALTSVRQNLLHDGWLSRDHADRQTYSLIKGR